MIWNWGLNIAALTSPTDPFCIDTMFVYPGAESSPEGDKSSKYNLAPALVTDMEQQCSQTQGLTAEDL